MKSKSSSTSIDQTLIDEIASDAKKAQQWGLTFILGGLLIQMFHLFSLPIVGITAMVIIAGIILLGSGILFYLGSFSVPSNRTEIINRLQKVMLDNNPERRLWAAQRLIGYMKNADFTKSEIIELTKQITAVVKNKSITGSYYQYIAGDHIILLRELAVSIKMDKHTRKEFVRIIKPLQKIKGLKREVNEILADAIAYHPNKRPIDAYKDLIK